VERRLRLVPLDTRIIDPEVGIPRLAPIGHSVGVKDLESKVVDSAGKTATYFLCVLPRMMLDSG